MFENITKGEFYLSGNSVSTDDVDVCEVGFKDRQQNAEFISYCFNLQQRFDISKLEEVVQALQLAKSHINIFTPSNMKNPELNQLIEQLLAQIKK